MSAHLTYTNEELAACFDRLRVHADARVFSVANLSAEKQLEYLTLLQQHFLASVPFESIGLHYAYKPDAPIERTLLYDRLVKKKQGGYCMMNNLFFGGILRSLGFKLYSAGARVFEQSWTGYSHMHNILTIGRKKYSSDVGFGKNNPLQPLLLADGYQVPHLATAHNRIVRKHLDIFEDPEQSIWVHQFRSDNASDWQDGYCFTETEFLPNDYFVMNYFTSTHPKCFFTYTVVACIYLMKDGKINARWTLMHNMARLTMADGQEEVVEMKSEDDRLRVLKEHFGIELSVVEVAGIMGRSSMLKL